MEGRYRLIGAVPSPYSVKMRAILRYRRLPFDWVLRTLEVRDETAHVKPPIIPILQFPDDGHYQVDSTPMAYELESRYPGARSILPDDAGHAFLSYLLEDMADEWGTKMMFHYRWDDKPDQDFCSQWIVRDSMGPADADTRNQRAKTIADRQIGRMAMVGSTPQNAPLIEETYLRVLDILEEHFGEYAFLFGDRPSLADFGWYGQLFQLMTDPTPSTIMRERAPGVMQWVMRMDDASGVEGNWIDPTQPLPHAIEQLLQLAGDVYLPFLEANAAAFKAGLETMEFEALGKPFSQGVFKYQVGHCLGALRDHLAGLEGDVLARTEDVLRTTGCWHALHPG